MRLVIHEKHGKDMRRYNQPTSDEIAAIFTDSDFTSADYRKIIIKTHEDKLQHINELNGAYDPLQYPLLFPYGEYGWHNNIYRCDIEPESVELPMDFDNEEEERHTGATQDMENLLIEPAELPMEFEERHTGATQEMENLLIESELSLRAKGKRKVVEIESEEEEQFASEGEDEPSSSKRMKKNKGKGKAREVEQEEVEEILSDNEEEEIISGNEQEEEPKSKRKWVTIREFTVYRI